MEISAGHASWPSCSLRQRSRLPNVQPKSCRRTARIPTYAAQFNSNSSHVEEKSIFILGLGYTSIALGNWLAADGWRVSGTCRTAARVDGLRAKGWSVDLYDPARGVGLTPDLSSRLEVSPYVLSSVPPLGLALYDPALSAQKALLRPLAASGRIAWFGYLSSTGVYGDWQGEWVDESSPCRQTSSKAIVRQEAEAAWLQMYEQYGLPAHIFRLGGIYGPGRSVLDSLQSEPADLSSSQRRRSRQRYTARCHVYDICAVLAASLAAPSPGAIYNIVDDDPSPRTDVMSYARSLLAAASATAAAAAAAGDGSATGARDVAAISGHPPPPDQQLQQSTAASVPATEEESSGAAATSGGGGGGSSRGREALEEKRVRNVRIREQLGVALRYPTYREGVAAIAGGECWPLTAEDLRLLQLS